jgi:hypothetical protein
LVKKILFAFLITGMILSLQGCLVAAVGAGVGAWKYGNAKKTEARAKDMEAYNGYVLGMQRINTDRQCKHLPVQPIMSYEQYMGSPAIK